MRRLLAASGAVLHRRVFEQNATFDTAAAELRQLGRLLRLRIETPVTERRKCTGPSNALLTGKSPTSAKPHAAGRSKYKERIEREVSVRNATQFPAALAALGFRPGFRYEKYRTSYRLGRLHIELDETPAGTFLELEGTPQDIDRVSRRLGFGPNDRLLTTYWSVYAEDCRRRGVRPTHMLFG